MEGLMPLYMIMGMLLITFVFFFSAGVYTVIEWIYKMIKKRE